MRRERRKPGRFRSALSEVLRGAMPREAVEVYEDIGLAMGPETLEEAEELSVNDAIVEAYLTLLVYRPDSFIRRKC